MISIKENFIKKEALDLFFGFFKFNPCYDIVLEKGKQNEVTKNGKKVHIICKDNVYAFRMLSHLFKNDGDFSITENPASSGLTYYTDCSRNGVVNLDFFKEMVYVLAAEGYNRLCLYTEDTYEVDNEPYFGHLRGRYTQEEIKKMVAFAEMFGIELFPGISTLAHLDNIFFWHEYEQILDIRDTIMIGEERTYTLIRNMFASISKCYKSREVHIGFDEAHYVCLGRYFDKHGVVNRKEEVIKHLRKVLDIAKEFGFNCSIWSDMFFILEFGGYYKATENKDSKFSDEILKLIPKDVKLIYWDYYHVDKAIYDKMFRLHEQIGNPLSFAGGSWNWLGYAPLNQMSLSHAIPAIEACKDHHIDEIYCTAWGDNGNECSRSAVHPTLFLYAEFLNTGVVDLKQISARLKQVTGLTLDNYYTLDKLNERPGNEGMKMGLSNPAKYLVYNDPLNGVFDYHISELDVKCTKKVLKELKAINFADSICAYTYETAISLAKLIIQKATIGNDIYDAYHKNDREKLAKLIKTRIPAIERRYKEFHEVYRTQWMKENKSMGFEVIQGRLSYQFIRLGETKRVLQDYLDGKITRIEELEQPKLSEKYGWEKDEYVYKHSYLQMANVFMNK